MLIEFAWPRKDEVEKTVAKLARRADRLGVEFVVSVSASPTRAQDEMVPCPFFGKIDGSMVPSGRVLEWGTITLETPAVKFAGWTLVGVLTPMPVAEDSLETTLYPTAVPGQEMPADVREWTFRCDHCGHERRRLETFVLRHEDGSVKQVGRQCIRDYLGHDADRMLSQYGFWQAVFSEIDEERLGWGGGREPRVHRLAYILGATSAVVRAFGWVSRGRARAMEEANGHITATADHVRTYLYAKSDKYVDEMRREVGPVTEADTAAAEAVVAFWSAEEGTQDYAQNARLLATTGLVIDRAWGLAVSLLPVWQMRMEKLEIAKREVKVSEHLGTVGERITIEVEVIGRREFESQYGTKTLVTMHTREGALVKWWASGDDSWLPEERSGEFKTITGMVKQHGEYNGRKETTINRPGVPKEKKTRKPK
jgi:hypothetical protein